MKSQKFNLTELIVVVFIVAVAGTLIIPTTIKALDNDARNQCLAKLKAISAAVISYTNDYDGYVWATSSNGLQVDISGMKLYWHAIPSKYLGTLPSYDASDLSAWNDKGDKLAPFICPADTTTAKDGSVCANYLFNGGCRAPGGVFANRYGLDGRKLASVKSPAEVGMVVDGRNNELMTNQNSGVNTFGNMYNSGTVDVDLPKFLRHGNVVNAAYADGHVSEIAKDQMLKYMKDGAGDINPENKFFDAGQKW